MKVLVEQNGFTINFKNKELKTPFIQEIDNHKDLYYIQVELRKLGIEYKIIYPNKNVVNLSGKELPFGCFKDPFDKRDLKIDSILQNENKLSSYKELSYKDEMSPVKNQGNLGSCVGFAVAAMKEWQEQKEYLNEIKKGNPYRRENEHYNFSEQWIYYKAKEIDPWPNSEGTSIRHALKQLSKLGVPPEKAWRYSDKNKGKPEIWSHMISKWASGGEYRRVKYSQLANALEKYGPLVIGIICFREIFNVGNDGFIKYPKNPDENFGGHAICLTGLDKNKNLYEFKNSWGTSWGNRGYGYFKGEYLKDFMLDSWIYIDVNTKKDALKS